MNKTIRVCLFSIILLFLAPCIINKSTLDILRDDSPQKTPVPGIATQTVDAGNSEPGSPLFKPPGQSTAQVTIAVPTINPMECLSSPDDVRFWYEAVNSSSGTGGTTCNAKLTFQNVSSQPVIVFLYTLFDNGKMKESKWTGHSLASGETGSVPVSVTLYSDGTTTYTKIP